MKGPVCLHSGTLESFILAAIARGPKHGHAIARHIQQCAPDVLVNGQGLIYPALHRLEQRGWIESQWASTGTSCGRAKFYTLASADPRGHGIPQPSRSALVAGFTAFSVALGIGTRAAANADADGGADAAGQVRVCLKQNGLGSPFEVLRAKEVAGHILSAAGVTLDWRVGGSDQCEATGDRRTLVVDLTRSLPARFFPGALGYSKVFEGTHGVVMYDRIAENVRGPTAVSILLGHVLAHEITHMLQGVNRHSGGGLMKENWTVRDVSRMMFRPLALSEEDIAFIRDGLHRGSSGAAVSRAAARPPH